MTTSSAAPGTTVPTTTVPTTTVPPATTARASAPSPAELHARVRLLREARAAVHAHDLATASARFDALLHASPRAPRILCEAGYVSHLAGRDAQAASRIDLALSLFGHDADLPAELRVPVAMCLFNRGLVAEAQGDVPVAATSWQRSLVLRPNATVSARLAALAQSGTTDADDDEGTVGGHAIHSGERSVLVDGAGEAAAIAVLEAGMAGEDWDGLPTHAYVSVWARATVAGPTPTDVVVAQTDDQGAMEGTTHLALVFATPGGNRIETVALGGYDATDHGHVGGCGSTSAELDVVSGLVRVRYVIECEETNEDMVDDPQQRDGVSCYESQDFGATSESHVILCSLEGSEPACAHLVTSRERTRAPSSSVVCQDDDGVELETIAQAPPIELDDEAPFSYTLEVLADRRVRVQWSSAPRTPSQGEHDFAELLAASSASDDAVGAPELMLDADREEAGGSGEDADDGE